MDIQYVARQPILGLDRRLAGYELLFRDSPENRCPQGDPDLASKRTMDTAMLLGLDKLSSGHLLFLNCTHDVVVGGFPTLFPAEVTVVEILETVEPSAELLAACRELKKAGYRIALDDFIPTPGLETLTSLADIIKVDVRATPLEQCGDLVRSSIQAKRQLLAEKVETEAEFQTAVSMGFTLFQGYLFSKPSVLSTRGVNGLSPTQFRILRSVSKPRLDYAEVEEAVKSDPALSYRLLRYLNSPNFYLQSEIRGILNGLVLLGENETRKWLLLVGAVIGGARPEKRHLLEAALVRARFAELLAPQMRVPGSSMFLLGLLSMMDAILDVPLSAIAEQVRTSEDIHSALTGKRNGLRKCLELIVCYENADWSQFEQIRDSGGIAPKMFSKHYMEAVQWSKSMALEE